MVGRDVQSVGESHSRERTYAGKAAREVSAAAIGLMGEGIVCGTPQVVCDWVRKGILHDRMVISRSALRAGRHAETCHWEITYATSSRRILDSDVFTTDGNGHGSLRELQKARNRLTQDQDWTTERRAAWDPAKETQENVGTPVCPMSVWHTLMLPDANAL